MESSSVDAVGPCAGGGAAENRLTWVYLYLYLYLVSYGYSYSYS
jgi:hypothetical protein